jgi:transcriptional regulator with XRE-family HTH domain
MDLSFGARLRAQRERRQVALATIAADTKIKPALLEALEHDDISQWPQGIFRRAYVRAYARAIGLDPEPVVREFLELYPEPVALNPNAVPECDALADLNSDPATRLRRLLTSAIAAVPAFLQRGQRSDAGSDSVPVAAPTQAGATAFPAKAVHSSAGVRVARVQPLAQASADDQPAAADDVASPERHADRLAREPVRPEISLPAVADLCTRLGQAVEAAQVRSLLGHAARILDAVGVIVWSWDPGAAALAPSLAHGYSEAVLAGLPGVCTDADNAIAAAFRSSASSIVEGGGGATGAVVVPLLTPGGCSGVLAIEVRNGGERQESVRATAAILAAQLATFFGPEPLVNPATA